MARPSVIFADEPTGNLDSRSSREVLGFLKNSVHDYDQTIVMVTHDPRAASYADRVLVLADGRITQDLDHPSYERILEVFAGDEEHEEHQADGEETVKTAETAETAEAPARAQDDTTAPHPAQVDGESRETQDVGGLKVPDLPDVPGMVFNAEHDV